MPRARIAIGLVVTAFLAVATPAAGAVRFGHDIDVDAPTSQTGTGTAGLTVAASTSTLPVGAPTGGVVTRMRLEYANTGTQPGYVSFRILRVSPTDPGDHRVRHASPTGGRVEFPLPASRPSGVITYLPVDDHGRRAGVPVRAGELLGYYLFAPAGAQALMWGSAGQGVFANTQDLFDDNQDWPFPTVSAHPMIDALLEPDRDSDGYGDETQDNCSSIPNDQTSNPCPATTVTVPGPAPAPVVVERLVTLPPGVGPSARLCTVPRLRRLTLAAATKRLERAGCRRGRRTGSRSRRARVRSQTIPAGTRVFAATRVGVGMRVPAAARRRS